MLPLRESFLRAHRLCPPVVVQISVFWIVQFFFNFVANFANAHTKSGFGNCVNFAWEIFFSKNFTNQFLSAGLGIQNLQSVCASPTGSRFISAAESVSVSISGSDGRDAPGPGETASS